MEKEDNCRDLMKNIAVAKKSGTRKQLPRDKKQQKEELKELK